MNFRWIFDEVSMKLQLVSWQSNQNMKAKFGIVDYFFEKVPEEISQKSFLSKTAQMTQWELIRTRVY